MAIQPIVSQISIGGRLLSSMPTAIRGAQLQLTALGQSAVRANATLMGLGKGLLGFSASFLAFEGVKSFLKESIALSKEEAGTHAALLGIISAQNKLRGIGVGQSKQEVEQIEKQAKSLQEMSGIYRGAFMHGAAQLKVFKLKTAQTQEMMKASADLMAFQKQMGMDTAGDFEAMGKAIQGVPRGLKAIGVEFTHQQMQIFQILNAAGRAKMIFQEIERQHGGAAALRGMTLGGQAELAKSHWTETMATIGDSWRPISQKLTVFFGSIAEMIAPPLIRLSQFIASQFDSWVKIIKESVIPVVRQLVKNGWDYLSKGIEWFGRNSKWLLPWIGEAVKAIGIWTFAIGPLIQVIGSLRLALMGLSLSNPFTALALVAGIAAYAVITHWTAVKKFFGGLWETILGTKNFNSTLEPDGVMRAFGKGKTPKAGAVQVGWIEQITTAWAGFTGSFKTQLDELSRNWNILITNISSGWSKMIQGIDPRLWKDIQDTMQAIANLMGIAIHNALSFFIGGINLAVVAANALGAAWGAINDWLDKINAHRYIPGMGDKRPDDDPYGLKAGRSGKRDWNKSGNPTSTWNPLVAPLVRGEKFTKWDATFDAAGKKYGIDPAFLKAVAQQENVASGDLNPLGISPGGGGPTHYKSIAEAQAGIYRQVALYANPKGPYAKAVSIDDWAEVQAPWRHGRAPNDPYNTNRTEAEGIKAKYKQMGGDPNHVVIHNNVTYNVHGGDAVHQIASLHHKHIEQLQKDIAEAHYRTQRSSFA